MTETLVENRIVTGLRNRTLSDIASEIWEPEKTIKPAILVMQTDGLVGQEEEPEPEDSAPVQNLEAQEEGMAQPEQARLIKRFRAAMKAVDDADAGILAAEKNSCLKHHRLGKVALELKKTFEHGEWGPFLKVENVDPNRINRAMRLAKYLTDGQCQKMAILEAELLIKKIRKSSNPTKSEVAAMAESARKEYESYRREQLRRAAKEAVVDFVDPQVGRYYRIETGGGEPNYVVHVTEVRDGKLSYIHPDDVAAGERLTPPQDISEFCQVVLAEASKDEFDADVEWCMAAEEEDRKMREQASSPDDSEANPPVETSEEEATTESTTSGEDEEVAVEEEDEEVETEQGVPAPSGNYIVRGDYRWSVPNGHGQEHDCWDRDDTVIGSIKCLHGRWLAVIELGKFTSKENAMAAVEEAWDKLRP